MAKKSAKPKHSGIFYHGIEIPYGWELRMHLYYTGRGSLKDMRNWCPESELHKEEKPDAV
ncbi:hypothetical protein LCGC14_1703250 [marine sediment metagenome]|uniref:Uncharacterized protein n=1 Tax=marine sediment metagenome TaxID=412755 RepID=A0A0F9KHD9_9ZZZZ